MNTKIFKLVKENLELAFNLPKYSKISIDENTVIQDLPWTPARYRKFKDAVEEYYKIVNKKAGTVDNPPIITLDDIPTTKLKYTRHFACRGGIHIGQRKLFLSSLQYMINYFLIISMVLPTGKLVEVERYSYNTIEECVTHSTLILENHKHKHPLEYMSASCKRGDLEEYVKHDATRI